ncbi:MAG: flippase-like domain-containing protein [Phycisphaeraceae bacterium]|nr:flippase-like domain-containing protein [Phycisphaeraceae bacterium]
MQVIGFAVCIGLLWWCAARALSPGNREQLAKLGNASLGQIAGVVALSAVTLTINGAAFWVVLRPVRRLPPVDVVAVNSVATLLGLAPFKLSLLWRVVVHRARDGLPVLTTGAWLAAAAVLIVLGVFSPVTASMAFPHERSLGTGWWATTLGIAAGGTATVIVSSRLFLRPGGWALIEKIAVSLPFAPVRRAVSHLLPRGHEGLRMLASPGAAAPAVGLRLLDIAVQTARFLVVAGVVGSDVSLDTAVLGASAYFVIGAVAPTGALGVREAGATGVFAALHSEGFAAVVLAVSAADTAVVLVAAAASAAWLRVDRLVLGRGGARGSAAGG